MVSEKLSVYDRAFYERVSRRSAHSASIVVPLLLKHICIRSVVDVGCGVGAWAAEFLENGIEDVIGLDGSYVDRSLLMLPLNNFVACDLSSPIELTRTVDLAVCLEVAEHLPRQRATGLVADLVKLAPCVLFSAAVPGQGGTRHINEQHLSYWSEEFATYGYESSDLIRPLIWSDETIEFWYRQNITLFISPEHPLRKLGVPPARDVIHPVLYDRYVRYRTQPTVGYLLRSLPGAAYRSFVSRFNLRSER